MNLELTIEQEDQLKELRAESNCQKLDGCDLNNLSPVKKIGLEDLLECLNENAAGCPQALPYGSTFFCKCHARIYLHHKLGI